MKTWKSIFKSKQVRKECLYSFLILMGIRLLATIPTPGTNPDYFKTLIHDNSALTFIDAMTGNGLSGMSIMALSITPYITASIMVQLAGVIYPHIHEMEKGMEDERKRIHIITLVLGGFVALMESSMIAISFGKKGLLVSAKWYWILFVTFGNFREAWNKPASLYDFVTKMYPYPQETPFGLCAHISNGLRCDRELFKVIQQAAL